MQFQTTNYLIDLAKKYNYSVHTVICIVYLPVPSATIRACSFSFWFDIFNFLKQIQYLQKYWCNDIFEIFMSLYSLLSLSWKLGTMHFNKTITSSVHSSCAFSPNHLVNWLWPITLPYNQIVRWILFWYACKLGCMFYVNMSVSVSEHKLQVRGHSINKDYKLHWKYFLKKTRTW